MPTNEKTAVCQIVTSLTSNGAENLVVQIALSLKKAAIPCTIIALFPAKSGKLEETVRDLQIPYYCCNYSTWYQVQIIFKLKKIVKRMQPRIIHSHLFPANYYTAFLKTTYNTIITTEHNVSNRRRQLLFSRMVDLTVYKKYNKVVCISDAVKNSMVQWVPSCDNLLVTIANGIDLDRFKNIKKSSLYRNNLSIPENSLICAMVGRLENPPKDQATIIKALTHIDNLHLILAGDGRDKQSLYQLASDLHLECRVHFIGYTQNVESLLACVDIYIHSTLFEGFGLSIIEALAAGLPVIATDVDGSKELLTHDYDALLFEQGNTESLVYNIKKIVTSKSIKKSLITNGLKTASKYSLQKMTRNYIELYSHFL